MKIVAFTCPRQAIAVTADRQGEDLAGLSRLIGRPPGYLGRFVRDGCPERLPVKARSILARYLGLDERDLGAGHA